MTLLERAIEESVATLRGLSPLEEPLNRAAGMVLGCLTSGHKLLTPLPRPVRDGRGRAAKTVAGLLNPEPAS